ncbi:prolargin-like [Culex pipiens pallens]|uniref:prolargin-like n=1 Tax=Culex pipiens pallens TaxID=42434 RepID=UPI0019538611|nr:prolargin-like [Culex pipiens pallens]
MKISCLVLFFVTNLLGCVHPWLYPCKQISWGIYTVHKRCILDDVVIRTDTELYKIFFPPVELIINSGFIRDFSKAVADRLSKKTTHLTVQFCGVERVFLRDTLEKVILNYNAIDEVRFDSAKDLKVWALHMMSNYLRDVSFVQNMTSLVILNLRSNFIATVSWETFKNLKSLATLELGRNRLKTIDGGDVQLPSLKRLLLDRNRLFSFDLSNANLKQVNELNISSNELLSLNLFNFEKTFPALDTLDISNNPWNCGRRQRLEDWMFLKRVTNQQSNTSEVPCVEDHLQTIALTVPDGTDRLRDDFQRLQYFYYDQLSEQDANQRLSMAKARSGRLQYDLGLLNNSVHTTGQKINHLFRIYNLRASHNMH